VSLVGSPWFPGPLAEGYRSSPFDGDLAGPGAGALTPALPLPAAAVQGAPKEVVNPSTGRASLLESIRQAGGIGKAKLRSVKERKLEKKKQKEQEQGAEALQQNLSGNFRIPSARRTFVLWVETHSGSGHVWKFRVCCVGQTGSSGLEQDRAERRGVIQDWRVFFFFFNLKEKAVATGLGSD